MDHNLLAILEETEDSDYDYDFDLPTVVSGLSEIQAGGRLVDQVRVPFKDRVFRPGVKKSARVAGDTERQGLIEVTTQTQTTVTVTVTGTGTPSTLGAIPRR